MKVLKRQERKFTKIKEKNKYGRVKEAEFTAIIMEKSLVLNYAVPDFLKG